MDNLMSLLMLGTQSCALSDRPLGRACHTMQIPSVGMFASTEGFRIFTRCPQKLKILFIIFTVTQKDGV